MTRQAARAAGNDTAARGAGNYSSLALSFARHLRASNLSPASIKTYLDAVERLRLYLEATGGPLEVEAITREHLQGFIEDNKFVRVWLVTVDTLARDRNRADFDHRRRDTRYQRLTRRR